jgi:phenylpropionate dioxygenase-like ring-hydroxylating dioxygenase large terminal subunit
MILVRGDDRVIRLLLNTCTHRGALVCRQKSGNARTFQCPYHAWTFNSTSARCRSLGRA